MADLERHWNTPAGFQSAVESAVPLPQIYNSLKDSKQTLVPVGGPRSKQLTWYECGPTVYDSAHMGHARNYVTFDIVRRILEDYFGYSILYVMNVTDVDDKIIRRAKRNYLLKQYQDQHTDASQVHMHEDCLHLLWPKDLTVTRISAVHFSRFYQMSSQRCQAALLPKANNWPKPPLEQRAQETKPK